MELVEYVLYMNIKPHHIDCFVYEINHNIRPLMKMWKLSLVVEEVENTYYVE
jgi:hypothetical protein